MVGDRWPRDRAQVAAEALRTLLEPVCERIVIAGSLRRGLSTVKDIELVAEPRLETQPAGLWGEPVDVDRLEERIVDLFGDGVLAYRDVEIRRKDGSVEIQQRDGERYKALVYQGIPVDLFMVRPPADFGVVLAIRTGPAEFSHRLVSDMHALFMRVEGGRLVRSGQTIPCDTEEKFFAAVGQPWLAPRDRRPERVNLQRALVR